MNIRRKWMNGWIVLTFNLSKAVKTCCKMGRINLSGRGLNLLSFRKSYKFCSNISKTRHVWFLWVKHSYARTKFHWNKKTKISNRITIWALSICPSFRVQLKVKSSSTQPDLSYPNASHSQTDCDNRIESIPHQHFLGSSDVKLRPRSAPAWHKRDDSSRSWWPRSRWCLSSSI